MYYLLNNKHFLDFRISLCYLPVLYSYSSYSVLSIKYVLKYFELVIYVWGDCL